MTDIFTTILDSDDIEREEKKELICALCQHTGDVWKCFSNYLKEHKWHLKTREKRLIVDILESYPVNDFRANLIITNKKAADVITMLEFLSYNNYSKSKEHKEAVSDLRSGKLRSWQSIMNELIQRRDKGAVSFIASRPGILLRSMNWLLKKGYTEAEILKEMIRNSDALSMHTITNVLTYYSTPDEDVDAKRAESIINILSTCLISKMTKADVPFRDKKVYIDWQDIDPENSVISKADEGGYIRSGLAIKLPELGKLARFFCFWNDEEKRIDIDLHALGFDKEGRKVNVGWDSDFRNDGIIFSGDITTSINSAEYIDVDLENTTLKKIKLWIHSYTGVPFKDIAECFTGVMTVSKLGQDVDTKLYNGKNVLWSHHLDSSVVGINYAVLDIDKRLLILDCMPGSLESFYDTDKIPETPEFNLKLYMESFVSAVNGSLTESPEDADIVLKPYKAENDKELSIMDNNYFLVD